MPIVLINIRVHHCIVASQRSQYSRVRRLTVAASDDVVVSVISVSSNSPSDSEKLS